jgi:PIN domain nuclease of toxin-antitoxin system
VSRYLLDASALLAVLNAEPGNDVVRAALTARSPISAANFSEVVSKLADLGLTEVETNTVLASIELEVLDFTRAHAYQAGRIRPQTRTAGLSIADRACLAVAKSLELPVLTGDHSWSRVEVGVKVELFR